MKKTLWLFVLLAVTRSAHAVAVDRAGAEAALARGDYAQALTDFSALVLRPAVDENVGQDFKNVLQCLERLNRSGDIDSFRDKAIGAHPGNWRLAVAAADSLRETPSFGHMIDGQFHRGYPRVWNVRLVDAGERDRARALAWLEKALDAAEKETRPVAGDFYRALADTLYSRREGAGAWRLGALTSTTEWPDYDDYGGGTSAAGAPVDRAGQPVFHRAPSGWATARSDGERWRWALAAWARADAARAPESRRRYADFLSQQFGVETLQSFGWFWGRVTEDESTAAALWSLDGLGEDETLARLATGVKRFKLPPEHNFIAIYKSLEGFRELAQIFENRRQYERAAHYWRLSMGAAAEVPAPDAPPTHDEAREHLRQILGRWGTFADEEAPAGRPTSVAFRFRNATSVRFEAHALNVNRLITDVKAYLRSDPGDWDWSKMSLNDIGQRIVWEGQEKYRGRRVASWTVPLTPRPGHFDRRVTVPLPFKDNGAFLITARVEGGNTSHLVVWRDELALVQKPVGDGDFYFVADAATGRPVSGAVLDFFGFRNEYIDSRVGRPRMKTHARGFSRTVDQNGGATVGAADLGRDHQWLVEARDARGRRAFLGFQHYWFRSRWEGEPARAAAFLISDRPVYRPEQVVRFRAWADRAAHDRTGPSPFAGAAFSVTIYDPQGKKVFERSVAADARGGFDGEFPLPADAALGAYSLRVLGPAQGFLSFRVEEYKKPEFEVTVSAPTEPLRLGDAAVVKIAARYYFGAPVTEGKVKFKVLRTSEDGRWYPSGPWDWLYGNGYGWLGTEATWWPGWARWGCWRPRPLWFPVDRTPPEIVAEGEAFLEKDGTLSVPIDTALAKALHPDRDHRYEITAEVTDKSRRTIAGRGAMVATRQPFRATAWTDRGFYRTGEPARVSFAAVTPGGSPLVGASVRAVLHRLVPRGAAAPTEERLEAWALRTNAEGRGAVSLKALRAGQYRLSVTITDGRDRDVETAALFTARGDGDPGNDFRFNDLEILLDRRTHAPGETARLLINTAQPGGAVLLFVRPVNGVYQRPELVRLDGRSGLREVPLAAADSPNIFVEAVAVRDGRVFSEIREILLPPESRALTVEVKPVASTVKPGETAKARVRLTDAAGRPVRGSLTLAVYDKSVEYISGGSNVADIREFFWKWRRSHTPGGRSAFDRWDRSFPLKDRPGMGPLGVFGAAAQDEFQGLDKDRLREGGVAGGAALRKAAAPAATRSGVSSANAVADAAAPEEESRAVSPGVEPTVRSRFADTALWVGRVDTDARGESTVSFKAPDNLTTWKTRAWAVSDGARVGEGTAEIVTAKKLLVRLQTPRFLVQKDEAVLSANVHNYLSSRKDVRVSLVLEGDTLALLDGGDRTVSIPPQGEARVDWRVRALRPGPTTARAKAVTDEESDAVEIRFPARVHGMTKIESFGGSQRPEATASSWTFRVPAERRPEASRLEIRVSPSLALAMVDALPYLADYPYGCTEQTLNRFLPTVITQGALRRLGISLADVREKRTNLNAQEAGDPARRARRWGGEEEPFRNPVFDEKKVADMAATGLKRLTAMQLSDGGWGWFSGSREESSPHTTAVVVDGLLTARGAGLKVPADVLDRGVAWLARYQEGEGERLRRGDANKSDGKEAADELDALVYRILVDAGRESAVLRGYLWRDRLKISLYAQGLLGQALHRAGRAEESAQLRRHLAQYVVRDDENETAHLRMDNAHYWWRWYGSETEAHAAVLRFFLAENPRDPVIPRLVKYLLNNRRHGTYWNSTRDTALIVEAFAEVLAATGEDRPDYTLTVAVDGRTVKTVVISPANLFTFENRVVLAGEDLSTGTHTVSLVKAGRGALYWNATLENFTMEDPLTRAGLEIKVDRAYYKLRDAGASVAAVDARGGPVDQRVEKKSRVPLTDGEEIKTGDVVLVELSVESKNDYEYILVEDRKPAGFEPVALRSGESGGPYMELRDERVGFFFRALGRGRVSVSYELRAETPGRFSALPARALGMYAPELAANSDEFKTRVAD
ncbi:MAG: alpha-2-macroglobulin [Elusimicrobia bacterium]|nr:alpha-2-macroglobulin [Elusimicrobiota bacterium]